MKKVDQNIKKVLEKDIGNENINENIKMNECQKLIPAIIQDFKSKKVLMLAYMNKESLKKSLETKTTWFWSRSRNELWNKGQTSGNKQYIREIRYDCDNDALLIEVDQIGNACHTGNESCFYRVISLEDDFSLDSLLSSLKFKSDFPEFKNDSLEKENNFLTILNEIYNTVIERIKTKKEGSYTYSLHCKGLEEILKKIGEESIEVILSSKLQSKERIISEISDLLYHLIVLMVEKDITFDDIAEELEKRRK